MGSANFYPGYGDTALGYDLSSENSGKEWIELKFADKVCLAVAFRVYQAPGTRHEKASTSGLCGPHQPLRDI